MGIRKCSVKGCNKKHSGLGYCYNHYKIFKKWDVPIRKKEQRFCSISGCNKKYLAKGYCMNHYALWKKHGNPLINKNELRKNRKCSVDKCNKKHHALGFCVNHYIRYKAYGNPLAPRPHGPRGERNFRWNGGTSYYKNHYLLKKNRLIILSKNPKCYFCPKKATEVAHKNGDKTDHSLANLLPRCKSCRTKQRSMYKR